MIQSLFVKLGMLAMTMGVILWIGWHAPQASPRAAVSEPVPESMVPGASEKKASAQENTSAATSAATVATQKLARVDDHAQPHKKGLLDLNRASADELESLPGIGAVLAQRVIDYRKSAGGFQSVDDLRQVKGIGAKKFDRVRPLVMVAMPPTKGKAEKQPL